ncbi:hypothetical protein SAMN04487950_3092 [Halogranum rubrum]|uniref:Copper resistance protein D n=1 Tax=Halogranum rubrum TaxID=553466 RepID=A0A1I4G799_9EURY|nr:hypothetical protein [Halogranum rubrum]SFL25965.1 hypothetical protein SAMN04487950_3092 [Halogranum rubrum]
MVPLALSHLAVRWLHVLGMALALGGALLAWASLRLDLPTSAALAVAAAYERLFWAAMGLLVMTGVGNLGALAPSIPGGEWSETFSLKLFLVGLVLLGSLVRSLLVVDARRTSADTLETVSLRRAYAATSVFLGLILVLAEVLAHG